MLNRQRQFGIKKEGTEGTRETLAAADFAFNSKSIEFTPETPAYERELMRASLSKDVVLKAVRSLTLRATVELAGGAANTASPWHDAVEACGFAKTQLKVVDVGAPSGGTFTPGDKLGDNATEGSAAKTGVLIAFIAGSPAKIVYLPTAGTFADSDTMYNYASPQVSATVDSTPANAGWGFRPKSETAASVPASATVEVRDGEQIHRIVGGRGMVEFTVQHNAPILMAFEFMGPLDTDSGVLPAAGFVTGITPPAATPVMGKSFPITFDAYAPVMTQLTLKVDNTLAKRATLGPSIEDSGYLATRITDRRFTISCDPEHPPVATLSWLNLALSGATQRLYITSGASFAANGAAGTAVIIAPKLQITENVDTGDREGITIDNLSMQLAWNGVDDDELIIAHVFI